jgi:hypothetical protein
LGLDEIKGPGNVPIDWPRPEEASTLGFVEYRRER